MTDNQDKNEYGKKYYKNNKEYFKKYYNDNKDDWYVSIKCEICDGKYNRSTKSRHIKSKKHIIAEKDNEIKKLQNKINIIKENLES